ncbi:MAG: phytochelatin synthase family protein [Phyllobacterium sp.]|uniref:phytochelatin synthase family protein n=1 Tax=Phyllobacterium sp. TaxID=1871046 RepID=UPI0030F275C5
MIRSPIVGCVLALWAFLLMPAAGSGADCPTCPTVTLLTRDRPDGLDGRVVAEAVPEGSGKDDQRAGTNPAVADGAADGVIYIVEEEGWRRLLSARQNRDYFMLDSYVESERFLTFCSIASMAAALNSLGIPRPLDPTRYPYPYFTQDNIFVLANEQVKSFEAVVTDGLTLAEIGQFFSNLGVTPRVHFAEETGLDAMRTAIIAGLAAYDTRVIVNYDRSVLGQTGAGHVSPIGAYDEPTDSVLVLDVARYKYPPAWVPMQLMYRAMLAVDGGSGRSRGIVLVQPADVTHH